MAAHGPYGNIWGLGTEPHVLSSFWVRHLSPCSEEEIIHSDSLGRKQAWPESNQFHLHHCLGVGSHDQSLLIHHRVHVRYHFL